MFLPGCFTVGMVFLDTSFHSKRSTLVSSDHMTFSKSSSGSLTWGPFEHCRILFHSVINSGPVLYFFNSYDAANEWRLEELKTEAARL